MAIEVFLRLYLLIFLKDRIGYSLEYIAAMLFIGLIIESFFAERIGRFGDKWTERGGSRWPIILAACLSTGLSLIALFYIPALFAAGSSLGQVLTLPIALTLHLSLAAAWVNYAALAGDLIDRRHAYPLIGMRTMFGGLSSLFTVLVAGYFFTTEDPQALRQTAWALCISLFLIGFLASIARVLFMPKLSAWLELEGPEIENSKLEGDFKLLPISFILLLLSSLVLQLAFSLSSSLTVYYLREFQSFKPEMIQENLIAYAVIFFLSVPVWFGIYSLIKRKVSVYTLIVPAGIAISVPLFTVVTGLKPDEVMQTRFWTVLWPAFFSASFCLMEFQVFKLAGFRNMLGQCYGLWWALLRIGRSLGMIATGVLLTWSGIQEFDPRSADRIAFVYGPGIGALILTVTALLLATWKFSRSRRTVSNE